MSTFPTPTVTPNRTIAEPEARAALVDATELQDKIRAALGQANAEANPRGINKRGGKSVRIGSQRAATHQPARPLGKVK